MLGQVWNRWILGKRTFGEVSREFPTQLNCIKLILWKWFSAELARTFAAGGMSDEDTAKKVSAQVVNYLCGEPLEPSDLNRSADVRLFALEIQSDLPEIADNLMRQDRNLREVIVYTLRMRLILNTATNSDFGATPQGLLVEELLRQYGPEFDTAVDERRFAALVRNLNRWAISPQFPGATRAIS